MAGITRKGHIAALFALGLAVSACSDVTDTESLPPTTGPGTSVTPRAPLTSSEPAVQSSMITTYVSGPEGVDNQFFGTLQERDGCMIVEVEGGSAVVPVFARNRWLVADDYVADASKEYRVGDKIEGGNSLEVRPDNEEANVIVPDSCRALEGELRFFSISPLEPYRSTDNETSDPRSHGGVGGQ